MLTQANIAAKVGVSRTAVAFALSDDPRAQKQIAPQTRQRIVETARQLGYRPHRQAQLLRGVKSGVIGVIKTTSMVQAGVERSFFVSQAVQAAGFGLLVNELHWDKTGERRAVDALLDARVEGVLLDGLGDLSDASLAGFQRLRAARIPVVAVGGVRVPAVPCVMTDFRQGMAALTTHLLALGYRTLALALPIRPEETPSPQRWGFAERLAGFREVAAAVGLSPAQARVLCQPVSASWTDSYEPGQAAIRGLIERGERPEVLLCSNDNWAIGALAACADAGWKVPDDIAITGFDATTVGQYARPALTTVAQPTEAVARQAVDLLLQQIRGEPISASTTLVKLPCHVVVRQSCGDKRNQPKGRQA